MLCSIFGGLLRIHLQMQWVSKAYILLNADQLPNITSLGRLLVRKASHPHNP